MKTYMTIREVARTGIATEYYLRLMVAQGKIPGVYSGKTFKVNYPMLVKLLEEESARNARAEVADHV